MWLTKLELTVAAATVLYYAVFSGKALRVLNNPDYKIPANINHESV